MISAAGIAVAGGIGIAVAGGGSMAVAGRGSSVGVVVGWVMISGTCASAEKPWCYSHGCC